MQLEISLIVFRLVKSYLEISAIHLEISLTHLKISLIELRLGESYLKISSNIFQWKSMEDYD